MLGCRRCRNAAAWVLRSTVCPCQNSAIMASRSCCGNWSSATYTAPFSSRSSISSKPASAAGSGISSLSVRSPSSFPIGSSMGLCTLLSGSRRSLSVLAPHTSVNADFKKNVYQVENAPSSGLHVCTAFRSPTNALCSRSPISTPHLPEKALCHHVTCCIAYRWHICHNVKILSSPVCTEAAILFACSPNCVTGETPCILRPPVVKSELTSSGLPQVALPGFGEGFFIAGNVCLGDARKDPGRRQVSEGQ